MTEALIEVLIPVFNAAKTVRSAIESIQHQTVREIRILVVDDGSTDDTAGIVAELKRADSRVEVLTKANGGIVDALNFGIGQCRARFLARHDGDDLARPERFAKQLAYLEAHPECVAVGGAARHIDETGRPLGHIVRLPSPDAADPCRVPSLEPYILHPFLMTYRASVERVGGYRHAPHAEDTDLYWRLREIGRLHNLPDVLGDYRMHSASLTSASILSGRLAALSTQLASISALRRREKRPDLTFGHDRIGEYNRAGTLENIYRIGRQELTQAEADHLEISIAAKLVELTSYRPFELDLADCRFIQQALAKHAGILGPSDRAVLRSALSGAAARLVANARIPEARALVGPQLYPAVLSRLAFRTLMPKSARRAILRMTGRMASERPAGDAGLG